MRRRWFWPGSLLVIVLAGCAEPPNREMDQAQLSLDAARAAGVEQYATDEYRAATDALKRSREAVTQRDYRLALNTALDSRERSQNAARLAADTKARLRVDIDRTMADLATLLAGAHARLSAAEKTRIPRRLLQRATTALATVNADVQKAGEAANKGDYLSAQHALKDVRKRIAAATAGIEPRAAAATGHRRAG